MRPFDGRRILLGVTGGIASYKSVSLARLLTQAGASVDVVLTRAAGEFVGAITFEAVTGRRSYTELFGSGNALDHVRLPREADLFLVAPATADFLARAAHGLADDLLTAALLANAAPTLLVAAMNDRMWANAQTRRNVEHLRAVGYDVLDPAEGPLAQGEGSGPGRMLEPEQIVAYAARALEPDKGLWGKRVLVTAGGTREAIDPVRFISNHSSGRMGIAVARAAWRRGAAVTLVAAHTDVDPEAGGSLVRVTSTQEMARAVEQLLPDSHALIMAAAPADFAPTSAQGHKIKKGRDLGIELSATPDILKDTVHARRPGTIVVGFALETQNDVTHALDKLRRKDLDLIVVNNALEAGAGFGGDTNRVVLLHRDGTAEHLPLMQKAELADVILDRLQELLIERQK